MNAPERVLIALDHKEPDRIPAFESTFTNNKIMKYYGLTPGEDIYDILKLKNKRHGNKILKKNLEKKDTFKKVYTQTHELFRRVGIDIVTTLSSLYPREILKESDGFIDEYGRIMKFEYYQDGTLILGYQGSVFKSYEDYESWEQPDPNWEPRINSFLGGRDIQKQLKNEIFSVPSTGALMELTWEGFGLEIFSRILVKPKQAKRVFDDRGKFTLELVKILAELDAKLIVLLDDYGYKNGLFMSPKYYEKYIFPWLTRICSAAHERDTKILLHSDGDLSEIFENLIKCGIDAINPIEPTTANPKYDIFELNRKFGTQITFSGNLNPMMLATGTITEIEDYAKKLIREIAPGGGYIFSSGHSINPAITIDRFEAMQNIRRKYGKYPINIPD